MMTYEINKKKKKELTDISELGAITVCNRALRMGGGTLLWDVLEGQGHSEAYLCN